MRKYELSMSGNNSSLVLKLIHFTNLKLNVLLLLIWLSVSLHMTSLLDFSNGFRTDNERGWFDVQFTVDFICRIHVQTKESSLRLVKTVWRYSQRLRTKVNNARWYAATCHLRCRNPTPWHGGHALRITSQKWPIFLQNVVALACIH